MSATRLTFIVALFGLIIYLPGLNHETGITDKDEYLLSLRTPIEMLEQSQYLTPYLDHKPRLKKPPLIYWLTLLNYKIFGITLVSARIWGVLSGIGLAIVTGLICRNLWKEQADGLTPALIVLSSAGISVQARMAMLDLPLAFFVTLSIYLFMLWKESGRRIWLLASASACGLSAMVKGPVGPLFVGSAIALNLILLGKAHNCINRWRDWLWAGFIFLLVAGSWPLAMLIVWKGMFIEELGNELIKARFFSAHSTGPSAILGGMLAILLPWSFLFLGAFTRVLRQGWARENRNALWLLTWSLTCSLPFLFLRVKFERYLLAAVPPAAIMVCIAPLLKPFWRGTVFKLTAILYGLVGLLLIIFGFWFKLTSVWVILLLLVALSVFCRLIWGQKKLTMAAGIIAVFHGLLFGVLYPGIGVQATPPELIESVKDSEHPVYYFRGDNPGLLSIHLKRSVQQINDSDQLADLSQNGLFLIVEERQEKDFKNASQRAGLIVPEPALQFSTFYSRVVWVRFPRKGTTWEDWKTAINERALQSLKTRFNLYYIRHPEGQRLT